MFGSLAVRNVIWKSASAYRFLHTTAALWALPPVKRVRVDPAVLLEKFERKKKKLEREIEGLIKLTKKPKPVEELSLDFYTSKHIEKHRRKPIAVEEDEQESRALLAKEYARFKNRQYKEEMRRINAMVRDQEHALKQLRLVSEDLYRAAIQPSNDLLPCTRRGPTDTPPIPNYVSPDGDYIDTTKTYEL